MNNERGKRQTARILTAYAQIWFYQLIGLLIFSAARIIYLLRHTDAENILSHSDSIPLLLWNAWRFDIQALTYIALPAILPTLVVPYFGQKAFARLTSFIRRYYAVMLSLLTLLVTAEFFFDTNFNSRYNVVFFDFFDEGPISLLQTMWQDYPFLSILAGIIATGCAVTYVGRYIRRVTVRPRRFMGVTASVVSTLLIAGLTFVFMRGSVTRYTLQVEAFVVSTDETMNNSVANCIYMLKKAYKERKNSLKLMSNEELLHAAGFESLDEAIVAAGLPRPSGSGNEEKIESALFDTVKEPQIFEAGKNPNVIIILSESWSNYLLTMDRGDSLNLLGALRPHLREDIHMKNIQSVRNGTIYTLETVTMGMPYMHFFNSRYRFEPFETSIAHPFKANGYATSFVTGMDPTWENVLEGLTTQYFDTVIGKQELLHAIPGSTTSVIGVYDEFLLEYIGKQLNSSNGQPQFIFALTTTNHPPFTYPEGMQLPPLTTLWYESPMLNGDRDILTKYGLGIQYTNETLGKFLTAFKASPLSENTIVIITGDHNVRSILKYGPEHVPADKRHAVPMYIYLPEKYRAIYEQKDRIEQRHGSHFDILPTIAPLAFDKGTKFLRLGNNLLDPTLPDSIFFSYNEQQTLSPSAANNDSITRMMQARETLMKIYYQQHFRRQ